MIEYVIVPPILVILYLFYQFFIKIYLEAWRFQKMDSTLKVFVSPFTGLLGVLKENIVKYGDCNRYVKDMVKENPEQRAYLTNIGNLPYLILCQA
jgi:hypothetical protein